MKLQDQLITLDQAKRLKELGVVQESMFYFLYTGEIVSVKDASTARMMFKTIDSDRKEGERIYSAFTVAELGVMLGKDVYTWTDGRYWYCGEPRGVPDHCVGMTEAHVKAGRLIMGIEIGELPIDEINKRLQA